MSNSVQPHRWKPPRLPRPWDPPGKNTGVGCHFLLQCMKVENESEVAQSCPTLSSLPGSSIHGILQARVLEWGAIAFSRLQSTGPQRDGYAWVTKCTCTHTHARAYTHTHTPYSLRNCMIGYSIVNAEGKMGVGNNSHPMINSSFWLSCKRLKIAILFYYTLNWKSKVKAKNHEADFKYSWDSKYEVIMAVYKLYIF